MPVTIDSTRRTEPPLSLYERRGLSIEKKLVQVTTTEKPVLRRNSSIRELRQFFLHKIPDKLFKRSNSSTSCLPSSLPLTTSIPVDYHSSFSPTDHKFSFDANNDMKCTHPSTINSTADRTVKSDKAAQQPPPVPTKDQTPSASIMGRIGWTPELSPVSFQPTLSVEISPLSPPSSPPPSRSQNLQGFRRKLSFRSSHSTTDLPDTQSLPRRPSSSKYPLSTRPQTRGHERRRSKYLNDPTVLSMLDRKFEEALELGFTSPPPTPRRTPSPHYESKRSPLAPSVDGTTIVETLEEEEEEDDIFTRPTPNLALPTLKELDDGDIKETTGDVMTLRLTLTPATCLTEVDETLPLEVSGGLGKRMSGLGRILSRTRSRKVRI